ncbi:MAG: hypothetical protein ISR52_07460 [Rhodospirillales bacterium]|nr:hypothetical protein [Rhodospirillales bacterium]
MTRFLTWIFVFMFVVSPLAAAELVYFHEDACPWCERWQKEVGVIYHKTDEAKVLPLREVEIDAPRPKDLLKIRPIIYTPTFVVMDGGLEVGRITGYPGEDFFWPMLEGLIKKLDQPTTNGQKAETVFPATKQAK